MTDQVVLLDIEVIDPPGDAVREIIDPDKIRELAESIRSRGLLQPILVRPKDGRYEVVAGHRRLLSHRLLGEVKIKSIVRELSDEDVLIIRAIENDQREDLNPIEKGRVYKRLRDQLGYTIERIAQVMGRNKMTVWKYLQILDIPEEFQKFIANGSMAMQTALVLMEVEDEEFRRYYFQIGVENGITMDVARMWVDDWKKSRSGSYYGGSGGEGGLGPAQAPLPIYQTCVCCLGPEEVNKMRYIGVCPSCEEQIRGALAKDKK